jgi:hypothetical protein
MKRTQVVLSVLSFAAFSIGGIFSSAETGKSPDVCKLLSAANLRQIQGSPAVSTRASEQDNGNLASSQCFFALSPFIQSVSLEVISQSPHDKVDVREFWNEKFHSKQLDEEEEPGNKVTRPGSHPRSNSKEDEEKKNPPRPLAGIGDDAFWVYTGRDGAVYALHGKYIIRVGVSGKGDETAKIRRASDLAKLALQNLDQ